MIAAIAIIAKAKNQPKPGMDLLSFATPNHRKHTQVNQLLDHLHQRRSWVWRECHKAMP